jgi:hypothetical protein
MAVMAVIFYLLLLLFLPCTFPLFFSEMKKKGKKMDMREIQNHCHHCHDCRRTGTTAHRCGEPFELQTPCKSSKPAGGTDKLMDDPRQAAV